MVKRKARKASLRHKIPIIRQLLPPPSTQGIVEFADWLEVSAWAQSDHRISRQEVVSLFAFQSNNQEAEEQVSKIWDEIRTRKFFLHEKYPFTLSDNQELFSFDENGINGLAYIFCLLISYCGLPMLMSQKTTDGSYLFEKLCTYAAHNYVADSIGSTTKNLQFGSPRKEWRHGKRTFKGAVSELIQQLGDGESRIDGVRNTTLPGRNNGDGGLDIVAWRSFPDEKRGLLVLLGQCATARDHHTYVNKISDLNKFINEYVLFDFAYILGLFVPHVLSHNDELHRSNWERIKRNRNIPFDRMRIILYGNDWQNDTVEVLLGKWRKRIKKENALV